MLHSLAGVVAGLEPGDGGKAVEEILGRECEMFHAWKGEYGMRDEDCSSGEVARDKGRSAALRCAARS